MVNTEEKTSKYKNPGGIKGTIVHSMKIGILSGLSLLVMEWACNSCTVNQQQVYDKHVSLHPDSLAACTSKEYVIVEGKPLKIRDEGFTLYNQGNKVDVSIGLDNNSHLKESLLREYTYGDSGKVTVYGRIKFLRLGIPYIDIPSQEGAIEIRGNLYRFLTSM